MDLYFKIQRYLACLLVQQKKFLKLSEPVISFTFDDAPNSAFMNGAEILKKYGFRGTYFISLGLAEQNRPEGACFDIKHLTDVVEDGGELGCHTYNHIHFYKSRLSKIREDLKKNQDKINELIPGYRFTSFAYPYGEQTLESKKLVREIYDSARSINRGINYKCTDLNNLQAVQLDEHMDPQKVFDFIEQAIRTKGWLVFYTHDVQKNPSSWGCTPEYFEAIVKYCYNRNIKAFTIEKVIKMFPQT